MTTIRKYQEQTGNSVHSVENQNILRKFVDREVVQNISMLVQHLLEHPDCFSGSDYSYDEVLDLCRTVDWEEAIEYATDNMDRDALVDYLENRGFAVYEEETNEELKTAVEQDILGEDESYIREFLEDRDVDFADYEREALEYWIVSDFLRRKLEEKGEATTDDLFGMTIWGRPTTGQAILLDGVIAEIALDMGILAGQEYEWKL